MWQWVALALAVLAACGSWSPVVIVMNNLMAPAFKIGDVALIQNYTSPRVGDIIVFEANNSLSMRRVISVDAYGCVQTKADALKSPDRYHLYYGCVHRSKVHGKLVVRIPLIGYPFVVCSRLTLLLVPFGLTLSYNRFVRGLTGRALLLSLL